MADMELIPFAQDFTPAILSRGGIVPESEVLHWLLRAVTRASSKHELSAEISATGLSHIRGKDRASNQRDMASHVIQGLQNYGLVTCDEEGACDLTPMGQRLLEADPDERDRLFARHILVSCNGQRLIDLIRQHQLRGSQPTLELLARELDRHPTSKNISVMRAWLARAGVMNASGSYRINEESLEAVLGAGVSRLFGLSEAELELLLAVRALVWQTGEQAVQAADAACLAEARKPHLVIPRKSLSGFVKRLAARELLRPTTTSSGRGGIRSTIELALEGLELADEELRQLVGQAELGFDLGQLQPFSSLLDQLKRGSTHEMGVAGEMLAVHICLSLGLRVIGWRKRAPEAEIDLVAERTIGLAYQRWAVQVKNTTSQLSSDRVHREIGAVAGTGITHILFVVPRAGLSDAASGEVMRRSQLTPLHIYTLTSEVFGEELDPSDIVRTLQAQEQRLADIKRLEAKRLEEGG